MIRVIYPNVGLYERGQPCWEQINKEGVVKASRQATDAEALQYLQIEATQQLAFWMEELTHELRLKRGV